MKADNQCQFGKWLYGAEVSAEDRQSDRSRSTKRLHAQFHEEASKIAQLAIAGQKEAAERAMGPPPGYVRISSALSDVPGRWRGSV